MCDWTTTATMLAFGVLGCTSPHASITSAKSADHDPGRGPLDERFASCETVEIPDGDGRGIAIGPLFTADEAAELGPVTLRLDISHPATGDLDVRLGYDTDGDNAPEVEAPVEFFRARSEEHGVCLHACPRCLDGVYYFRDCEHEQEQIFAGFEEFPRGGAFYLIVADTLAGEAGCLHGWEVALPGVR